MTRSLQRSVADVSLSVLTSWCGTPANLARLVSTQSVESFSNKMGGTSIFRPPLIIISASAADDGHDGLASLPNASSTRSEVAGMNGHATVAANASKFTLVRTTTAARSGLRTACDHGAPAAR